MAVLFGAFVLLIMVNIYILHYSQISQRRKYTLFTCISIYLFLILYTTVIGRNINATYQLKLMPLWSIDAVMQGQVMPMYEKMYNVIMYIPIGFMFRLSFKTRKTILIGFCISIFVELLQLITRTGVCETDDVICNTFGSLVGAIIAVGTIKIASAVKNRKR